MLGQRATMHVAQPWACREVAAGLGVRQFEFNPHAQADRFVACGTVRGHAAVVDLESGRAAGAVRDFGRHADDAVLGICWLRREPGRFLAGSAEGAIRLVDAEEAMLGAGAAAAEAEAEAEEVEAEADEEDWEGGVVEGWPAAARGAPVPDLRVVHSFPRFGKLTIED